MLKAVRKFTGDKVGAIGSDMLLGCSITLKLMETVKIDFLSWRRRYIMRPKNKKDVSK